MGNAMQVMRRVLDGIDHISPRQKGWWLRGLAEDARREGSRDGDVLAVELELLAGEMESRATPP